mmetsp:Transcript_3619/g.6083  ORF Transcript_3619/g.6083 Transcript_3619/m.6083 type:complete len:87 (-) Transcript_3619:184-444(-)
MVDHQKAGWFAHRNVDIVLMESYAALLLVVSTVAVVVVAKEEYKWDRRARELVALWNIKRDADDVADNMMLLRLVVDRVLTTVSMC